MVQREDDFEPKDKRSDIYSSTVFYVLQISGASMKQLRWNFRHGRYFSEQFWLPTVGRMIDEVYVLRPRYYRCHGRTADKYEIYCSKQQPVIK